MRSVTIREPVWTEQDRAEILALAAYRDSLCPCGCGLKVEDTTSREQDGPQFRASRVTCRARMALIEAQRAATQDLDKPSPYIPARLWRVEKR
ncbi:hypothetical protein [Actinoplanes sp. N902-109]|uniref:hypothetical protein n=1 Tax=Actinoplanes sp. (strain N902-109) TaxID=649831 RepID=UPI0003294A0C|nr:hypothetical protein [Actinoplanes sp. N902-109]AGL13883.1 hypothetical protein L083_0373 [Actinoplanes sp. N902-109]